MNQKDLYNICRNFREAIVAVQRERGFHRKSLMQYFPNGCCGNVTSLLRLYLKNNYVIDTNVYWYDVEPYGSHAFLKYHDLIIDLTGKQQQFDDYDRPLVYVDYEDDFYNSIIYRDEYHYYDLFQKK